MCKKIETNENFFSLGEILVREISPELLKQESETGDILGCNATGEKILTTTGYGNLNVRSSNLSGREPLIDFARNQIYQRIRRGDSIVIIDPERRLHTREMWIYLTIHGYCVDSYDLDCMDGSCCFNCLSGFDKKLRKEDLDLIQRIANDIINDQRHNVPFAVDKISKILLSAVMIAAITEMEEKDRNMVEIATIFRLGVSGIMLDKILHVMFDEIDISHPGKKLFEIYSEAPVGIKLYAIQRVADALKVYEDYISENFKLHQYDMAMPIKQKCVLFVTPGKTAQDKVLFSSFMEKLYDMITAICTKDWIMRGPADREWLKIKKDNEKYKICRNSDITMYVGLRGFFDIDDGESDPWKDKTYEDFYIGGYFISRYEQDAGIYYKNSKGEKIEDAGCNQYMSKKNPYGIQKT